MNQSIQTQLHDKLLASQNKGLKRSRLPFLREATRLYHPEYGWCLNFSSNDYLGLSTHPAVIEAFQRATKSAGTTSSSIVCGYHPEHQALEAELAAFVGTEACLLFSSGYMANLGIISSFATKNQTVLMDKEAHASLYDGVRLSGAKLKRYPHLDHKNALKLSLKYQPSLVISEGVFSMDGLCPDRAELDNITELSPNCLLLLDDAHGFGLSRPDLNITANTLYMASLSKAIGVQGGFVAASQLLIDYLIQQARTNTYTTAMPVALASAARQSLALIQATDLQEKLRNNICYFRGLAQNLNLKLLDSNTAIQSLIIGDVQQASDLSLRLAQQGIWLYAMRPPTVPEYSARLRICLQANHSFNEIEICLNKLKDNL